MAAVLGAKETLAAKMADSTHATRIYYLVQRKKRDAENNIVHGAVVYCLAVNAAVGGRQRNQQSPVSASGHHESP